MASKQRKRRRFTHEVAVMVADLRNLGARTIVGTDTAARVRMTSFPTPSRSCMAGGSTQRQEQQNCFQRGAERDRKRERER